MSTGLPITPIPPMGQLDGAANSSLTFVANGTEHVRHMPVDFSLLRHITLLD